MTYLHEIDQPRQNGLISRRRTLRCIVWFLLTLNQSGSDILLTHMGTATRQKLEKKMSNVHNANFPKVIIKYNDRKVNNIIRSATSKLEPIPADFGWQPVHYSFDCHSQGVCGNIIHLMRIIKHAEKVSEVY